MSLNESCGCEPRRVPTYNANCLLAQPDLAPCEVRRKFADEALGRVTIEITPVAGTVINAATFVMPGFAAAARVCFRAVTVTLLGDGVDDAPVTVDIVRLAAVRLYEKPDGSWAWARSEWTSEQASLVQATTGRCACAVACAECVPPIGGWVAKLEFASILPILGDKLRFVIEYKAERTPPCCELTKLCGEPEMEPVAYGSAPEYINT